MDNFRLTKSIFVNKLGSFTITLEPGEYYYKHVLYPVESGNSMLFVSIYTTKFSFPIHCYNAQSALTGSLAFNVIIPWHFVINNTITFTININSTSNVNPQINSLIEISKR